MTQQERLQILDVALRAASIQLHKDILETAVKIIDLIDKKKGETENKRISSRSGFHGLHCPGHDPTRPTHHHGRDRGDGLRGRAGVYRLGRKR